MSNIAPITTHYRSSNEPSFKARLGVHLVFLASLVLAAAAYPMFVEFDPWHGHAVIGGSNHADKLLALLGHRHTTDLLHSRPWENDPSAPAVLSYPDHTAAMLASLLGSANPVGVAANTTIPLLLLFLTLPLGLRALIFTPSFGFSPPSPPPRIVG